MVMKGEFEGRVLDVKRVENEDGSFKHNELAVFQRGERETMVVRFKDNGVSEDDSVIVRGRVSVNQFKGRVYTTIYADSIEVL